MEHIYSIIRVGFPQPQKPQKDFTVLRFISHKKIELFANLHIFEVPTLEKEAPEKNYKWVEQKNNSVIICIMAIIFQIKWNFVRYDRRKLNYEG